MQDITAQRKAGSCADKIMEARFAAPVFCLAVCEAEKREGVHAARWQTQMAFISFMEISKHIYFYSAALSTAFEWCRLIFV